MKKTILLNGGILLLFFIFSIHVSAQKKGEEEVGRLCGTSRIYDALLKADPEFAARMAENEKALQAYIKAHPNGRPSATQAPVLTLPLMVHVMAPDGSAAYNPTTADINSMIIHLNQGFRNTIQNACGLDIEVQFQLAVRKPDCTATTGIDTHDMSGDAAYVAGGVKFSTTGISDAALKALHQFDPASYINIWIVNKIDGVDGTAPGSAYVAGYATPPGQAATSDGVVMLAKEVRSFNPISNFSSRTLIHEIGHYLGLPHTFQGDGSLLPTGFVANQCPATTAGGCSVDGDMICDTEPYYLPNDGTKITFSCAAPAINPCTSLPFVANASSCTVLNNYMGYASNDCQRMFTDGQKTRMRAVLNTQRAGLLSSLALTAAAAGPPAACTPTAPNGLGTAFGTSNVTFNGLNISSYTSSADGTTYTDRSCLQKSAVVAGTSYPISIGTVSTNSHCRKVYVDWNNDGDFVDAGELVSTTTGVGTVGGTIAIPNTALPGSHRMRVVTDFDGGGSCPAGLTSCNLTGYTGYGSGQAEDFTLDVTNPFPVNLLSFTASPKDNRTVEIKWETATEENSDYFVIERSENLKSFENVATVKSGGNTSERRSYSAIDNNPTIGTNYYRLKEFAVSGTPRVYSPVAVNVDANNAGTIVYPNPNNGTFIVSLPSNVSETATFKLSTILGTDVSLQSEKAGNGQFKLKSTSKLTTGVYMLTIQTDTAVRNLKVIVQE